MRNLRQRFLGNCLSPARCVLTVLLFCLAAGAEEAKRDPVPYTREFRSGTATVRLALDRTVLGLDETITLTLEAEAPESYIITLPELQDGVKQFKWELLSTEGPALTANGTMLVKRSLLLEPILIPEQSRIGPMVVRFQNRADGQELPIETEEVPLDIQNPPPEYWQNLTVDESATATPMDRLAPPRRRLWPWFALAGVLLLAAFAVWYFTRKKVLPPPPPPDPYEVAIAELRVLVEQKLIENGETMEYYNRIQQILRNYIEGRFALHAPERTTEEFLTEITGRPELEPYRVLLQNFLTHCDLVRFAKHNPELAEIDATYDDCLKFLTKTRPAELPAPEKTNA
ncbi:MAG: hypothetical protein IJJ26_11430 [Victivallales bacterium]|nr:hypothetical protein [Victivallales bacterium]